MLTSEDGKYAAIYNEYQTGIYDITTGEKIGQINGRPLTSGWGRDYYPVFSSDKILIKVSNEVVEVWSLGEAERITSITGLDWLGYYDVFDVSPDGRLLAGGKSSRGEGNMVDVVDLSTGELLHSFLAGSDYFSHGMLLEFSKDSQQLITSSIFGQVILWDTPH